MNIATALQMPDRVIGRVERTCTINGRAFSVSDGDGVGQRQYIALSVGQFRWINHHHNGLLFQVASTPDEASRYTAALICDPNTLPVVAD